MNSLSHIYGTLKEKKNFLAHRPQPWLAALDNNPPPPPISNWWLRHSISSQIVFNHTIKKMNQLNRIQSCDSPSMYLGTCSLMLTLYVNANWQNVKSTGNEKKRQIPYYFD